MLRALQVKYVSDLAATPTILVSVRMNRLAVVVSNTSYTNAFILMSYVLNYNLFLAAPSPLVHQYVFVWVSMKLNYEL